MTGRNRCVSALVAGALLATLGCDGGKSAQSFSAFERCLIGAPPKNDAELAQRWRALELSLRKAPSQTTAADWPKRCEAHANALFQSLGSASESTLLRKELSTQMGCSDQPGSCKFPEEGPVLPSPAALWRAVSVLGLERPEPKGVEAPTLADKPLIPGAGWPALAPKDWSLADSHQTAGGKLWLLLRAPSGRVPVRLCELAGSADPKTAFAAATCRGPHPAVPALPLQSVMLVDHDAAPILAGLTETGRKAYEFETNRELVARGYPGSEVTEGIAVERGDNDEGYEAYVLAQGKAGKAIEIEVDKPLAGPRTVGSFVAWVEKGAADGEALVLAERAGPAKLKPAARLVGPWGSAELRACRTPTGFIVASYGLAKGNRGAQATEGSDGTRLLAAFYDQETKKWVGPVSGKLPFDRESESPPTCTAGTLALAWAKKAAEKPSAGRLSCTPAGCQASESGWTALGVQGWAAVAPLAGEKLLVAYRTTLGDVRARLGAAQAMDQAEERLLVDDQDHGGPLISDPTLWVSPGAAVLLFKGESGFAGLRIGGDGAAQPLPVNLAL